MTDGGRRRRHDPERDLDLAVELVNTHYVLGNPPDQLTSVGVFQAILRANGLPDLADELLPTDLDALRQLRTELQAVFAASSTPAAVSLLDGLLREHPITARLEITDDTAYWDWPADQRGMPALRARLVAALAEHVMRYGTRRLGVCDASPCRCVFVDRSRARLRRYCCDQCNDRAAAAAYRRRQHGPPAGEADR